MTRTKWLTQRYSLSPSGSFRTSKNSCSHFVSLFHGWSKRGRQGAFLFITAPVLLKAAIHRIIDHKNIVSKELLNREHRKLYILVTETLNLHCLSYLLTVSQSQLPDCSTSITGLINMRFLCSTRYHSIRTLDQQQAYIMFELSR